jgi:hypothetical protein
VTAVNRLTVENRRLRGELEEVRRTSRTRIRELEIRLRAFHVQDFEDAKAENLALHKEIAEIRRKAKRL